VIESQGGAGTSGTTDSGGAVSSGGTTSSAGATSSGGTTSSAGTRATGGALGGTTSAAGTKATGGMMFSGGTLATSGTTSSGGATSSGGTKATGGATSPGGATFSGGATSSGGTSSSGGTTSMGGTTSTGGTTAASTDCKGQALAKPGDSTSTSKGYLNLGDIRLINNRWGADKLGCSNATYKVYVNADKTIGYDFNRPTCGGAKADPDFPEVEFGVAPFGKDSSLLTSPACSSTTLLPIQIKNLTSASVNIDNFASTYQKPGYFDTNFEFWISKNNPATSSDGGVYAEIIAFFGWDGVRMTSPNGWPCDKSGSVSAGSASYNLCHQSDTWSSGWRFFNFNVNGGPMNTFSGKADVKVMLDWVMSKYSGFTTDMWLTRIEVGTEVDDNTSGTVKINNLTFEVNGTTKSIELAQ
jgi:hypothetical protein